MVTKAKGSSLELDDDLTSTATGKGASLVAAEDSAGNFTGTDLETILAELAGRSPIKAVLAKSANYTVLAADKETLFNCTSTFTLTLIAAGSAGDGFSIAAYNSGSGTITIDGNGAETINGAATLVLAAGDWVLLSCTGTAWVALISKVSGTFVNNTNGNPNLDDTAFDIDALAQSGWREIGPTGATNVWSPLNDIPTDVDWIEVTIAHKVTTTAGAANTILGSQIYVRNDEDGAGTPTPDHKNKVIEVTAYTSAAGNGIAAQVNSSIKIPVTLRTFELYWSSGFSGAVSNMFLIGYGYNS